MRAFRSILSLISVASVLAMVPQRSVAAATDGEVSAPGAPLSQEQFLTALSRDLAAHFNLTGELTLEFLRPWAPPGRIAGSWQVVVSEYPAVASASMLTRCRVLADGATAGEYTLVLRAALWRDVWVARQPLPLGATFDPAQLDTRRVDLFRERDALPADVGDNTFVFTRSLIANRLLSWRDIARRPLVHKGEMVDVAASEGALLITLKALAMENGASGDTIIVRNTESKKDIRALVVAESRVQVRF